VIEWPASEPKADVAHTVPLEGNGLAIVRTLMQGPPLWCPFLFQPEDVDRHAAARPAIGWSGFCTTSAQRALARLLSRV